MEKARASAETRHTRRKKKGGREKQEKCCQRFFLRGTACFPPLRRRLVSGRHAERIPNFPKCCILWTVSGSKPAARPPSSPITVHFEAVRPSTGDVTALFALLVSRTCRVSTKGAFIPTTFPSLGNFPGADAEFPHSWSVAPTLSTFF